MRGHEAIIRARLRGFVPPRGVWFCTTAPQVFGDVQYAPQDNPRLADLRFVVGLPVTVMGTSATTTRAWADACKAAGASRVIWAVMRDEGEGEFMRSHVTELGDTAGLLEVA